MSTQTAELHTFCPNGKEVSIGPVVASEEVIEACRGIKKRVRIIFRPFAGNAFFLYDHRLRLVQDPLSLWEAGMLIVTNIKREPGVSFEGFELLDSEVEIRGLPGAEGLIRIEMQDDPICYTLYDQFSLLLLAKEQEEKGKIGRVVRMHVS